MAYVYRDPISAAFMVKHHGLRLGTRLPKAEGYFEEVTPGQILGHAIASLDKVYFVRPDTLSIFAPRLGDCYRERDFLNIILAKPTSSEHMVSIDQATEQFAHRESHDCRIIERDGKPFFWPESD